MPDHPMLVASERQRLILNFPPWQAPAHLPGQAGKPHSQRPADAAPTATSPARDPLRPLLWLARREGQLLLVNESGDDLHAVRAEPYGYHLPPGPHATPGCWRGRWLRVPPGAPGRRRPGGGVWTRGSGRDLWRQAGGPGSPSGVSGNSSSHRQGRGRGNRPHLGAWGESRSGYGHGKSVRYGTREWGAILALRLTEWQRTLLSVI